MRLGVKQFWLGRHEVMRVVAPYRFGGFMDTAFQIFHCVEWQPVRFCVFANNNLTLSVGNYILGTHKTSSFLTLDKSSDLIYNDGTLAIRLTKLDQGV